VHNSVVWLPWENLSQLPAFKISCKKASEQKLNGNFAYQKLTLGHIGWSYFNKQHGPVVLAHIVHLNLHFFILKIMSNLVEYQLRTAC